MQWYPHKTVATIVEQDRRFLMVEEQADGMVVYNQPAGHLEAGETLLEAARRETLEETGWEVEPLRFLGLYHYVSSANQVSYIRSCFIARPLSHDRDRLLDPDIIAAHWLTLEQIRQLESAGRLRSPVVLQVLEDYLSGVSYPLSVITSL
ncbi:MAG: NUDIX hydrolase [Gammaproteobacteria bacterium]|nr:NUDIX hydrolase [Pseudomonadales bacterium]MCP5346180.1 NUDIX hydrolase [Pseudomonadales bacterium]